MLSYSTHPEEFPQQKQRAQDNGVAPHHGRGPMGNVSSCFEGFKPPQRPKGKLALKYFDIAGRAEPIRLVLALGEYNYQDIRLRGDQWSIKEKESTPFHQLPVLYVDDLALAQTKAILRRFTAELCKYLYPLDPFVSAKVDEQMDAFDDLWILLAPTYRR
eukprot:Skav223206  [mRNA]  locus=scaffold2072:90202:103002:+ [translate_table: standard]